MFIWSGLLTQSSSSTWIGLTYNASTSTWVWTDGLDKEYSNWNSGEPNNIDSEMCGEIIDYPGGAENGKWNNLACTQTRSFGCEYFPSECVIGSFATTLCLKDHPYHIIDTHLYLLTSTWTH